MISVIDFFNSLKKNNVNCFCGVPDSLLKDLCAYITDNTTNNQHTITANEGNAIGLAAGHYLATGNPAVVYMQNSGIGNCINPLLSLVDEEVYNIPVLMLIGWRGEPNKKDEPQHIKQGKISNKLLDVIGIKYEILPDNFVEASQSINKAFEYMKKTKCPFAFIIKKGTFENYTLINKKINSYSLKREEAIEIIIKNLKDSDIVVSTTGYISREVYETRERLGQNHKQDFLTVGSMGHSSSIALGIAIEKNDRNIYCFDGDGAFLMHMGAIVVNASKNLTNYKHIIFNNEAHDSVGSQPTVANYCDFTQLAKASGYRKSYSVETKEELMNILPKFISLEEMALLEIKVKCGARENLGRPKEKPSENKKIFMDNLNQVSFIYRGAIRNLSKIFKEENIKKALIFTGKKSFKNIENFIKSEINNINYSFYNDFEINPKEEDVKRAIYALNKDYDIIVAIGGGSVIDFSKAFKFYSKSIKKLIAIPTTCGTGSEATQFAVIYINGEKQSLDSKKILPIYSIVDSQFVDDNPRYLKSCTSLDAFCQAIESYWAIRSTQESKEYAKQAIELCRDNIVKYVNSSDKKSSDNMMLASHLAGKAINISRTTAAHALSYRITTKYGIPHGHAVALSIPGLFEFNIQHGCFDELKKLISNKPIDYFLNLFNKLNIEYNLKKLNIKNIDDIIDNVNIERLNNNPIQLNKQNLYKILNWETYYKH